MVRKLAFAVSLALGTMPLSVYALGLGGITTRSALNEKFQAEIELLSVEKGELDTLQVKLAPAGIFERNGIERPFVLSQLRFEPVRLKNGKALIRVTSNNAIREPFLDFFVEVSWPNGQLTREYTVLLDPPVLTARRAPKVSAPAAAADAPTPATRAEKPAAEKYRAAAVAGEYGPVAANETLWQIAAGLKPAGTSVHQMMMALYKANPEAFVNRNINLLKKGRVLRVPAVEEVQTLGKRQAVAEFQRYSEGWVADTDETVAEAVPDAVEAAVEAPAVSEPEASPAEEGRLKIAGAEEELERLEAGSEAAGSEGGEALKQKMLLVEEQAATARQEVSNLRADMEQLQAQLADMKRLLELKDQDLARLQAQVAEKGVEPAAETDSLEAEAQLASVELEELEPAEAAEAVGTPSEEMIAEQSAEDAAEPVVTETSETVAAEPVPAEEPVAETPAVETEQTAVTEAHPEPVPPAQPGTFPDQAIGWLKENWQMAAGGGVVLLLVGLLLGRRKSPEEEEVPRAAPAYSGQEEEESILLDEQLQGARAAPGAATAAVGDTSFLSEYSTEDLEALHEDTAEVDPVSEADVYIAYGRYKQAEEILKEAMENGEQGVAIKHKMLEVYYATQQKDAFLALAAELKESGLDQENPGVWEHIQTMGRDLDRSNSLFGTAAGAAAGVAAASAAADTELKESELSLDLSMLADEVDSVLSPDSEPLDGFSKLELDLPSLQISSEEEADAGAGRSESGEEVLLDGLGSDEGLGETELHTELADISDLADLGIGVNNLDDDLVDLSSDLENVMADSRILDEPLDVEEEGIAELEGITAGDAGDDISRPEGGQSAGGDSVIGDEVETKLELARAFLEIGDADGARAILNEVQEDGTPEQKGAASELLAQLQG